MQGVGREVVPYQLHPGTNFASVPGLRTPHGGSVRSQRRHGTRTVCSGSLRVAAEARLLSRSVGAVLGPMTSVTSAGPPMLLRDGTARVVTNATDVEHLTRRPPERGVERSELSPEFSARRRRTCPGKRYSCRRPPTSPVCLTHESMRGAFCAGTHLQAPFRDGPLCRSPLRSRTRLSVECAKCYFRAGAVDLLSGRIG